MSPEASDYEEYQEELPGGGTRLSWRLPRSNGAQTNSSAAAEIPDGGPDWYFPKGFAPKRVADRLRETAHFAQGGGQLYVYRKGVYAPDGSTYAHTQSTEILGDRWSKRRADDVVSFLIATSPAIWGQPSLEVVNVRNGLLEVATGLLRDHTPDFLSPVQLGAEFHEGAECPLIDKFIGEVFPGDAQLLAYELAGYLLTPDTRHEQAVMLQGAGSNGKSTYLNILTALLGGTDNVSSVTLQALDNNRFSAAGLYGKLANVVADLDAEALRSSANFKAIVSGDLITGERKYGTQFSFRPYARLLFSANEPPPTKDTSHAYFRRWIIVPFEATFEGKAKDKDLAAKLLASGEMSGFLNRALEGLRRLRSQGGFTQAESLKSAAEEFRIAVDSAAAFVSEQCAVGPDYGIARPQLYLSYKEWCPTVTRAVLSARRFNERVKSLLPDPSSAVVTVNGTEQWRGITLASKAPTVPPPESAISEGAGGERVEKVEEVPYPSSPGVEEAKEKGVERTSTLSTQRPPCTHRPPNEADRLWSQAEEWGEIATCVCCGAPVRDELYDGGRCQLCAAGVALPERGGHLVRAIYDSELVVAAAGEAPKS